MPFKLCNLLSHIVLLLIYPYLPTPPLGQYMTQGRFLSRV